MNWKIFSLAALALLPGVFALYSYGEAEGDSRGFAVDSGVNALVLDKPVKFFTHSYGIMYINTDGVLSFGEVFPANIPKRFPLERDEPVAALLWADHDLSVGLGLGNIWFRASIDVDLMRRADNDVLNNFKDCAKGFSASAVYVVTWENVTYQGVTKFDECLLSRDESFCTCLYIDGFSNEHCECMQERNNTDFCECLVATSCQAYCECLRMYNTPFCECIVLELGQHDIDVCLCLKDNADRDLDFCECYVQYQNEDFCECTLVNKTSQTLHDFCECMHLTSTYFGICQCLFDTGDDYFCRNCFMSELFCECLDDGYSTEICNCTARYENIEFCKCSVETGDEEFCKCRFIWNNTEEFCDCLSVRNYNRHAYSEFCECYEQYNNEEFCNCYVKFNNEEVCQCLTPPANYSDPFFCYCLVLMNDVDYCQCFVTHSNCSLCECYAITQDYNKCDKKLGMGQIKSITGTDVKDHLNNLEKEAQTRIERMQLYNKEIKHRRSYIKLGRDTDQQHDRNSQRYHEEFQSVLKMVLDSQVEIHAEENQLKNTVDSTPDKSLHHTLTAGKTGIILYNTYQAVIITNGRKSFMIYNYDAITWLTGNSGGGVNGQGGTMASVGFNKRNGLHGYNHPFSMSTDLFKLVTDSNTGQPGQWMYMVSKNKELLGPECTQLG